MTETYTGDPALDAQLGLTAAPADAGSAGASGIDWTSFLNNGLPRSLDAVLGNRMTPQNLRPVLPNQQGTLRYDPSTGNYVGAGGGLTLLLLIGLAVWALKG